MVQPPLYNVDLEQMHVNLYRGKYLTPLDFLEDIQKMVHNSEVLSHLSRDDADRLFRAQAMLTATQVSVNEFDPQLRQECERMAPRERQRRAEWRARKEKEKASAGVAEAPAGARRSGRHTGKEPEMPLTDPTKLERRLKRQRSHGGPVDSQGSDEDGPEAKRSKNGSGDEAGVATVPGSPLSRHARVHFEVELGQDAVMGSTPPQTNGLDVPAEMPAPMPVSQTSFSFLLNPAPMDNPIIPNSHMRLEGEPSSSSNLPIDGDPFQTSRLPITPPPHTPTQNQNTLPAVIEHHNDAIPVPESMPVEMVIERTPSPLPEFHIDDTLVSSLVDDLRDKTESLGVEQLEQLRATCLGCVWRRRTDWNRHELLLELKTVVQSFVEEVADDLADLS